MLKKDFHKIFFFFMFVACWILPLACQTSSDQHEKAYLDVIRRETRVLKSYLDKGYADYLAEYKSKLPQIIDEKNEHVRAINANYAKMDRQKKNDFIETWRSEFSKTWNDYEHLFQELKQGFVPVDESQKTKVQELELEWQILVQEHQIESLEPPLFFPAGD